MFMHNYVLRIHMDIYLK